MLHRLVNVILEQPSSKKAMIEVIPGEVIHVWKNTKSIRNLKVIVTEFGIPYVETQKENHFKYLHDIDGLGILSLDKQQFQKFRLNSLKLCSTQRDNCMLSFSKEAVKKFQIALHGLYESNGYSDYLPFKKSIFNDITYK
jgi:hypothetical protein